VVAAGWLNILFRAIEYGVTPEGMKRMGESTVGEMHNKPDAKWTQKLGWMIYDIFDVSCNVRGLEWVFGAGTGVKIPKSTRVESRSLWLQDTLWRVCAYYIMFDIGAMITGLHPGHADHSKATIFTDEFGPSMKYVLSTLMTLFTGFSIIFLISFCYDIISVVAVLVFRHDPKSWPPIYGQPWAAHSIHEFWGTEWHQVSKYPSNKSNIVLIEHGS